MITNRRGFMKSALAASAVSGLVFPAKADSVRTAGKCSGKFRTQLHKALIAKQADDGTCEHLTKAGFHGVELRDREITIEKVRKGRQVADKHGVRIHSYMYGWATLNHEEEAKRRESIEDIKEKLSLAAEYGASTMLLVPGRTDVTPMPKPTEFKIEFDPKTLHVTRVADGDPAQYAAYMAAQNFATDKTRKAIEELIPVAAREGVVIAIENVWNNLWVSPDLAGALTRSFDNPWVKFYFDLGNSVRYTPTEEWLDKLGSQIVKLHIKDFKIDRSIPRDGKFVPIGKGDINWKSVRRKIDEVNYNGWVTIESSGYTDAEHSALMDRFFAGEDI